MSWLRSKLVLVVVALGCVSCVERTISITSEPSGALVWLNDEEVGRTPVTVPFLYYGTYDVRLQLDGYAPLWTRQKADAPWWEAPGPDLVAEALPDTRVEMKWHFTLKEAPPTEAEPLIDRARQLRATLREDHDAAE